MRQLKCKHKQYRVTWVVDVLALSPLAAAATARTMQLDPDSTATYFTVEDSKRKVTLVDL